MDKRSKTYWRLIYFCHGNERGCRTILDQTIEKQGSS